MRVRGFDAARGKGRASAEGTLLGDAVRPPSTGDFSSTANLPKPTSSNTGPRIALTRSMTADEALTVLRRDKFLSGVEITGTIRLGGTSGSSFVANSSSENWVLEDCKIIGTDTYTFMSQYWSASSAAHRPIIRYCELVGRGTNPAQTSASAVANMAWAVLEYCELYGCADGAKMWTNSELSACYVHDLWHNGQPAPNNSHTDCVQIQSGDNIKVRWNTLDATIAYQPSGAPDNKIGAYGSGVLQTGSLLGSINKQLWHDNWMDSANIICRMGVTGYPTPNSSGEVIDAQYRRNKFGRRFDTGPTSGGKTGDNYKSSLGGERFDTSNVYEDTGTPV